MVLLARSPPRVSLTCTTFRVPHAWGVHQAPASLLPQRRVSHLDKHVRHTVIAMCQTTQDTIRLDDGTFVHAPVPQCAAPASTATLLILLPGALLQPDDYKHLARALQVCWSGVCHMPTCHAVITTHRLQQSTVCSCG